MHVKKMNWKDNLYLLASYFDRRFDNGMFADSTKNETTKKLAHDYHFNSQQRWEERWLLNF